MRQRRSLRICRCLFGLLLTAGGLSALGCGFVVGIEPFSSDGPGADGGADGGAGGGADGGVMCAAEPGKACWATRAGDASEQSATDIKVDGDQNILVSGWFAGALEFDGCEPLVADAETSFASKLTPEGTCIWSRKLGKVSPYNRLVQLDADVGDHVYVAGSMDGPPDGVACTGDCGALHAYLVKLDKDSGAPAWCQCFGKDSTWPNSVAADTFGGIVLAGFTDQGAYFGCDPAMPSAGSFVAKFGADGACVWSEGFPNAAIYYGALTNAGEIVVTGNFNVVVPAQDACAELTSPPDVYNVFVMKLHSDGACQWQKGFPVAGTVGVGFGVATDAPGNIAVTGSFKGALSFGSGGALQSGGTSTDTFLAVLDASGDPLWSRQGSSDGFENSRSVAFDSKGAVIVAGGFGNHLKWGDESFTSAGNEDAFVTKLEPLNGDTLWSRQFGSAGGDIVMAAAIDGGDRIVAAGAIGGPVDFGSVPLVSAGGRDVFVVKLQP